jgi:anti-repressor protein
MRRIKSHQSNEAKSIITIASSSGKELPIIQQGESLLIDARLLHKQLKVKTVFADWIKRRIQEFGFEEIKDYFSNLRKSSTKPTNEYHLTLDMAKELAMLERNDVGRQIRRYFIQKEKEARGISQLPPEHSLFKGIKPRRLNDRLMYPYKEVLSRCGYSINSSSHRRHKYWMHFVKEGSKLFITQDFALHLFKQKQVVNNRAALQAMQPVLPLNFGDTSLLKGGRV